MNYSRCETCGEYDWTGTHRCPPRWTVRAPDDDWETSVYARSADTAAEKAVEWLEENGDSEFRVASGKHTETVKVEAADGTVMTFDVTGYFQAHYTAEQIDEEVEP